MGYTSKYKGAEIDALLDKVNQGSNGGGVPIVSSEEERDALNLPVGSLVSVVKEGTMTSIRDLYQPQSIDDLDLEKLSPVKSLNFLLPDKNFSPNENCFFDLITEDFSKDNAQNSTALTIYVTDGKVEYYVNGTPETLPIIIWSENWEVLGMDQDAIARVKEILASQNWYYASRVIWDDPLEERHFDDIDKWVKVGSEPICETYRKTFDGFVPVNAPDSYSSLGDAQSRSKDGELATVTTETEKVESFSSLVDVFASGDTNNPVSKFSNVVFTFPDNPIFGTRNSTIMIGDFSNNKEDVLGVNIEQRLVYFISKEQSYELATYDESGNALVNSDNLSLVEAHLEKYAGEIPFIGKIQGTYDVLDQFFAAATYEHKTSIYLKEKKGISELLKADSLETILKDNVNPNYAQGQRFASNSIMFLAKENAYTYAEVNGSALTAILSISDNKRFVNGYIIEFDVIKTAKIDFSPSVRWKDGTAPTFDNNTTVVVRVANGLGTFEVYPK